MPKRKKFPKIPDYVGIPLDDDKLKVQKSNPLLTLSKTNLTLPELKILDAYLSRINSHDEEKRCVRFEKGELEKILGVERILKDDLSKRLDSLFTSVTIQDPDKPKGFIKIGLFEKADVDQDENGLWQIDLVCTSSAREYIFNIENLGYLTYMLKNVIDLTSRYSYVLYLYLEHNRYRHEWKISLDELKKMLNCTADTYSQYYRFNELVLKKCREELHKKTELRFTYEPTDKKGRKYTAIKFTVETFAETMQFFSNQDENQLSFADTYETERNELNEYRGELAELLAETSNYEFSPVQIRVLQDLILEYAGHNHIKCVDYFAHKLHITNYRCKKKDTESRFKYLERMISNDIKNPDQAL